MTDRELLEAAARAYGRVITAWNDSHDVPVAVLDDGSYWQPLHNNHVTDCLGDALRLAVKLRMTIDFNDTGVFAGAGNAFADESGYDTHDTRRAIVRAAAAMVKEG
jgi:hypothetical protein